MSQRSLHSDTLCKNSPDPAFSLTREPFSLTFCSRIVPTKIFGFSSAPSAVITAGHPVSARHFPMSSEVSTPPFAITGTSPPTASATLPIASQQAPPKASFLIERSRPCTVRADTPVSTNRLLIKIVRSTDASQSPLMSPRNRIFAVTGIETASRTAATTALARSESSRRKAPKLNRLASKVGHPRFTSTAHTCPVSSRQRAATAISAGSSPAICAMRGESSGRPPSNTSVKNPAEVTSHALYMGVYASCAPCLLQSRRNARSDWSTIGDRTRRGDPRRSHHFHPGGVSCREHCSGTFTEWKEGMLARLAEAALRTEFGPQRR
mmetsp:Transcript_29160/g.57171  ORF Transcript_29160/g.57171 Transcript_29160/m.57171 type:complete len:323 (-) Transcript_29160:74-1042(-)